LPFDEAAVIHGQHSEASPSVHVPFSNPRTVESDGHRSPQQTTAVGGYNQHHHCWALAWP